MLTYHPASIFESSHASQISLELDFPASCKLVDSYLRTSAKNAREKLLAAYALLKTEDGTPIAMPDLYVQPEFSQYNQASNSLPGVKADGIISVAMATGLEREVVFNCVEALRWQGTLLTEAEIDNVRRAGATQLIQDILEGNRARPFHITPPQVLALRYYYIDGISQAEVGGRLGNSGPRAAGTTIDRGKKALASWLALYKFSEDDTIAAIETLRTPQSDRRKNRTTREMPAILAPIPKLHRVELQQAVTNCDNPLLTLYFEGMSIREIMASDKQQRSREQMIKYLTSQVDIFKGRLSPERAADVDHWRNYMVLARATKEFKKAMKYIATTKSSPQIELALNPRRDLGARAFLREIGLGEVYDSAIECTLTFAFSSQDGHYLQIKGDGLVRTPKFEHTGDDWIVADINGSAYPLTRGAPLPEGKNSYIAQQSFHFLRRFDQIGPISREICRSPILVHFTKEHRKSPYKSTIITENFVNGGSGVIQYGSLDPGSNVYLNFSKGGPSASAYLHTESLEKESRTVGRVTCVRRNNKIYLEYDPEFDRKAYISLSSFTERRVNWNLTRYLAGRRETPPLLPMLRVSDKSELEIGKGQMITLPSTWASSYVHLSAKEDPRAGRILVIARLTRSEGRLIATEGMAYRKAEKGHGWVLIAKKEPVVSDDASGINEVER